MSFLTNLNADSIAASASAKPERSFSHLHYCCECGATLRCCCPSKRSEARCLKCWEEWDAQQAKEAVA